MIDLAVFVGRLKVTWIKKMLDTDKSGWMTLFQEIVSDPKTYRNTVAED